MTIDVTVYFTATERSDFYQYCSDNIFSGSLVTNRTHWFVLPAVGIIILFSFLEKRNSFKYKLCGGRPAPVRPLSFLDEPSNRWGIAVAFGAVTGNFIQATLGTFNLDFPLWAKIFLVYVTCLEMSVVCYPLFLCMTSRHKLAGAITGLLYSAGWFTFEMFANVQIVRCYTDFQKMYVINPAAHVLIQEFPVTLCHFLVLLKFCHKLYKCIIKGVYKNTQKEQSKIARTFHTKYVKHLLQKPSAEEKSLSLKNKFLSRFVKPVPGFRFPIGILVTTFMSSIILYMVALYCAEFMEIESKGRQMFKPFINLWTAANIIATIVTLLCGIKNIFNFVVNYRRDMLLLYRGDRSFIPQNVMSNAPQAYMARGMRFIGTAIVGSLWGTVFCYLVVFVPMVTMFMVFRALHDTSKLHRLFEQFQWMIYPACVIAIFQLQMILIGRCFIQPRTYTNDKHKPLAVNNRNMYDIMCFFMLFVNASIGLLTFLKRILVGALMGIFLIPRMDRSLLMRGYEAMDKCYVNYIGMIMVDFAHNNPTMRVFCHVIKEDAECRRDLKPLQTAVDNAIYSDSTITIPQENTITRAKRRWWLAYTLTRNPSLVQSRRLNPILGEVSLNDIESSVGDEDNIDKTGSLIFSCWKKCTCTIPPNISTNLMATLVLLMFALLYAGIPLLMEGLQIPI